MLYFNRCNVIFSLYLCMRYVFVHSYLAFFLYIHILHFSCSVLWSILISHELSMIREKVVMNHRWTMDGVLWNFYDLSMGITGGPTRVGISIVSIIHKIGHHFLIRGHWPQMKLCEVCYKWYIVFFIWWIPGGGATRTGPLNFSRLAL